MLGCRRKPQSKPIEMLLLFGYGQSLINQIPDIWSLNKGVILKQDQSIFGLGQCGG